MSAAEKGECVVPASQQGDPEQTDISLPQEAWTMTTRDDLLRTEDVSKLVGLTPKTLANRRSRGEAPAWIKAPGASRVLYRRGDVLDWLYAGRRAPGQRQDRAG